MSRTKNVTSKAAAPKYDAAKEAKNREGAKRHLNTHLLFWTVCSSKACKRARGCRGEPFACFDRWWPLVPEEIKIEFRTGIKAMADGHSVHEALTMAKAEVARWCEMEARERAADAAAATAAVEAAPVQHQNAAAPRREPPTPRVRAP